MSEREPKPQRRMKKARKIPITQFYNLFVLQNACGTIRMAPIESENPKIGYSVPQLEAHALTNNKYVKINENERMAGVGVSNEMRVRAYLSVDIIYVLCECVWMCQPIRKWRRNYGITYTQSNWEKNRLSRRIYARTTTPHAKQNNIAAQPTHTRTQTHSVKIVYDQILHW